MEIHDERIDSGKAFDWVAETICFFCCFLLMWLLMNDRTGIIRNIWGICTYMQVLKKTPLLAKGWKPDGFLMHKTGSESVNTRIFNST